jgi:Mg/Co/Ni transporter MgtE
MAVATKYPIPVIDENGKLIGEIDNETILSSMVQYKETEAEKPKTGKKKKAAEESQSNV